MMIRKFKKAVLLIILIFVCSALVTGCGAGGENEEPTESVNAYENLAGDYSDVVGERATMTIQADKNSESADILVSWASSATETMQWQMKAVMKEDKLIYENCESKMLIYNENEETPETKEIYRNGSGYFELKKNGVILWSGAEDRYCRDCKFILIR